jgi:cell wall-associated NlpC family hydrolase
VRTRRSGSTTLIGTLTWRGAAISLGLVAAGALVMTTGVAGAAPQPTVTEVQQRLAQLTTQAQRLEQQYAAAQQQLSAANQQLSAINTEVARDQSRFGSLQAKMAQIATAAYENGDLSSPEALLVTGNPQEILNQSSMLLELESSNSNQVKAFLAAARQLENAQQSAQRVRDGKLALKNKLAAEKAQNNKLAAQQTALLQQLTPAQQMAVSPGTGGTTHATNPVPVSGQAGAAVQFAYNELGCPYVFGGTGPCGAGFDCSGLTQAAWAAAGVSIPRTSEEQWAGLPHVSTSDLQPGDILVFNGAGHVGLYVGNNMLIDAPHSGLSVEKVALSGWYQATLNGAVRP